MVNTYVLVNPYIEGTLKTKIKAKNSNEAAHLIYNDLAQHFNNSVNKFHFTLQKGSSGEGGLYHFEVKERKNDNEVTFAIKELSLKNNLELENKFKNNLEKIKNRLNQDGGKHKSKHRKHKESKDSSDSSSDWDSDSEDFYRRARSYPIVQPINYWWYDPYLYKLDSIFIPTFYPYITPYIEVTLNN